MNSSRKRILTAALSAAALVSSTFGGTGAASNSVAPPDRGRFTMPFGLSLDTGERILSFEDEFDGDEEDVTGQSSNGSRLFAPGDTQRAWLLKPDTFNRLSSAGQRAVLRANGLLGGRARRGHPISLLDDVSAEAVPGENIRVNNPALDVNFHTHSETSIAINGSTIIISFNEFEFNGYGVSTDGGNTWAHKRTPAPPGGGNFGDGVVAFGPNGESYYAGLAFLPSNDGTTRSIIGVAKSTDNGATFSTPADASTSAGNGTDVQDKEWLAVDRGTSSPFKGNVYVSWTDFTRPTGNFINFARSTDGGVSFRPPVALSPQDATQLVQGSAAVVASNGDIYVAFSDGHSSIGGIAIVKSTDGGRTFSAETRVSTVVNTGTMTGGGGVRSNSFPSMTVDSSGAVHIVYDAWTLSLLDRSDIFYTRSTDGGATFSPSRKLNDDNTTTTQLFPSIAAASDGTLGVKWWDRRNDAPADGLTDVYMTISHDGGANFGKNFRVTNHNWQFGPIELGFAGGYHGDYDGIAADGSNFYLSWSDERNNEADAYFSQVPTTRDPNAPDFNISAVKQFDSVIAGNSSAFDCLTSAQNGFTGSLNLSASPAVSGLTYNFASSTVNAGSATSLNVSTSPGVQPGVYLITVTATGSGLTRKTNVRLTVLSSTRFAGVPLIASRTKGFTNLQAGIQVDAAGTVHVVFDDDSANVRNDDVLYARSTDAGRTFSAPIKVSGASSLAVQSTLALDSAGNPYIVWTGFNPNPIAGSFATFFTRSTDHGGTFSAPAIASGVSRSAQSPKIAVNRNGAIAIAYIDVATSGVPVFTVRSSDGGATFSSPLRVSQPGESIGNPPFIALDSTAAAYVTYQDSALSVSTIKLAVAPAGQGFGLPKVVSDSQIGAFAPHIAIDNNDRVFVTFYDRFAITSSTFNRDIIVIKSSDKGATFSPQVNVSNNLGQSTFPSLIVDSQGRVSVAWEDTSDDPQRDVYVARSDDGGATFGFPINLSGNNGRSFGAFGGADGNGNVFVAWTDDSGANTEVYLASLNQSSPGPPDFTLSPSSAAVTAQRASRVQLTVSVNRFAGFGGNVTVTPPDLAGLKAKAVNFTPSASGGVLSFKLKGGGVTGPQPLTFTGRDDAGRTRSANFVLIIQPAQ